MCAFNLPYHNAKCLCDFCNTRLRKHDGYLNVYSYQFVGPLDDLSDKEKDDAIQNNGIVPNRDYDSGYGIAFHGKLLPPKRPFGKFERPVTNKSGMTTMLNPYRQSTDVCERYCCADDCREYGDALERYLECRERCPKQSLHSVTKMCGMPPINPGLNGCKKNWEPSFKRWSPDMSTSVSSKAKPHHK
jgi:hypothetical protein